jgi:Skp family chaperone for outer membrane proteins
MFSMLKSKMRWFCAALCCAGALSATSLMAAPQYGGRLSSRMGARQGGQMQSMLSRGGYGKRSDSSQSTQATYTQGANSQGSYSQGNSSTVVPQSSGQGAAQSVITKVVPEKIVQVGADTTKKVAAILVAPVLSEVVTEANSAADTVLQEKDSIEQAIAKRQQELKALQDRLAEKAMETAKEKAKEAEDIAADELKQALEIVRKTRLEAQKRIEEEKNALEAKVKKAAEKVTEKAAQKAEDLIDAAEKSVLTGVTVASQKLDEKLAAGIDKVAGAEAALAKAAADRLSKLEQDHQLAMQQLQKLAAEREQQQEQMKKLLELMQQMLTGPAPNSKP